MNWQVEGILGHSINTYKRINKKFSKAKKMTAGEETSQQGYKNDIEPRNVCAIYLSNILFCLYSSGYDIDFKKLSAD